MKEEDLKKEYGLIPIDEIREKVLGYVKEHFKEEETPIFDPIFREEDGKYYLGYMVAEFVDAKNDNYRMKRPTKWLLVDIVTGELVNAFDSKKYDYTDKDKFPFDLDFDNYGNSALFDSSNYVLSSYFDWKKKVIKDLNEKFSKNLDNMIIDPKVLRLDDETISPNDFVLANVESVLEDLHNEIMEKFGGKVQELYKDYTVYLISLIRKHYVISGDINRTLLSSYIDLIKYSWPDFIEIINAFDNIEHTKDMNFENALKNLVQTKKERIKENAEVNDLISKIDSEIEKIKEKEKNGIPVTKPKKNDPLVNDLFDFVDKQTEKVDEEEKKKKLKEINKELNIDESTSVDDTIATLDKKIAELEDEEKTSYTVDELVAKIDDKIAEIKSKDN